MVPVFISPDFCYILLKGLNILLDDSKKHCRGGETPDNKLPFGIRYNSKTDKFTSEFIFTGEERPISLFK